VVSFGKLGVFGRNGWFCREADVERWHSLAGYRGLRDPAVKRHFNSTFLAFEPGWGPDQELQTNLDLHYDVEYLGADEAPRAIQARLDAGLPTLFYLWSPHPLNAKFGLNRIQLPAYSPALFAQGRSDYPTDVLEKVGSEQLARLAPAVAKMYSLFGIDSSAQEAIFANVDAQGLSVMQASCAWMRQEENLVIWEAWQPVEKASCDVGHYVANDTSCAPCPPGSASVDVEATACVKCAAGATPPL
jgi:ABC-type proline/glycine betaine transport system substrate-binding protein